MKDCLAIGQLHVANICGFCAYINDDIEESNNVLFCNLTGKIVNTFKPGCDKYYDKEVT